MSDLIQAVRGMNDVLPAQVPLWRSVERVFERCMQQYGYQEIRFPLVESTALFKRSIGEVTDIVEKEMYTFTDLNGESITLRPEGTACCVRACLEHGLLHNQQQKLWYVGSMFRHEKPQKGRYRQFTQFGVEAFGYAGVTIELELLALCQRLWRALGLSEVVHLQINTLGALSERQAYRELLTAYFSQHEATLDDDSKRRLHKNPFRILDSKNPALKALIEAAPKLLDVVNEDSKSEFQALCNGLDDMHIPYTVNPSLVRGLDYYGGTVFEWVTECLGSQATVCAGGRFDKLIEHLGGHPTPAVGLAMGVERLLLLIEEVTAFNADSSTPFAFIVAMGERALEQAVVIAESLRDANPDWPIVVNVAGGSYKSQFKKADKSGARFALILGDDELAHQQISIKELRIAGEQCTIPQAELVGYLMEITK